jgi:hypothetical protein
MQRQSSFWFAVKVLRAEAWRLFAEFREKRFSLLWSNKWS